MFFLENDESIFSDRNQTMNALDESLSYDLLSLNEACNSSDLAAKDILIESMQREAYYTLNESDNKETKQGIGNAIKSWFQRMWEAIKKLFNKVKTFFQDIFAKLFGMGQKLKKYVEKHKEEIKNGKSATVNKLRAFGKDGKAMGANGGYGFPQIKMMSDIAISDLRNSVKSKDDVKNVLERMKPADPVNATVTSKNVFTAAANSDKMIKLYRNSQQTLLKNLKEAEKTAKNALSQAKSSKQASPEKIKQLKEEVSWRHAASVAGNKLISRGCSLLSAMLGNMFKGAKALVKKAKTGNKETK